MSFPCLAIAITVLALVAWRQLAIQYELLKGLGPDVRNLAAKLGLSKLGPRPAQARRGLPHRDAANPQLELPSSLIYQKGMTLSMSSSTASPRGALQSAGSKHARIAHHATIERRSVAQQYASILAAGTETAPQGKAHHTILPCACTVHGALYKSY